MQLTATELAELLGTDYLTANTLAKFMVSRGAAKEVEKRKSGSGKGKPSTVYELPESFTVEIRRKAVA